VGALVVGDRDRRKISLEAEKLVDDKKALPCILAHTPTVEASSEQTADFKKIRFLLQLLLIT